MKLITLRALPGPNVYIHKPVLKARIELEDLTEKESTDFPGLTERLLARLPGLRDHHCAKGEPGGFVERLHGGTYFGHIVEHVTLELSGLAGAPANFGRTPIRSWRRRCWRRLVAASSAAASATIGPTSTC